MSKQQKTITELLFGDRSCTSKPSIKNPNQNKIKISSVMWWSSKSISSDSNQGRRSLYTKVSPGSKRRSQLNRSFLIYKTCVWFSTIFFTLEAKMNEHLSSYTETCLAEVAEIKEDLYVDHLVNGGENFEQVVSLKDISNKNITWSTF